VEWYINGIMIGQTRQEPHILPWLGELGDHTLIVKAYDAAGNIGQSKPVRFTLQYD
jgi:hypothetical protein